MLNEPKKWYETRLLLKNLKLHGNNSQNSSSFCVGLEIDRPRLWILTVLKGLTFCATKRFSNFAASCTECTQSSSDKKGFIFWHCLLNMRKNITDVFFSRNSLK